MPRFDELLGITTVAAAGMFVAIAFAPVPSGAARPDDALSEAPAVSAPAPSSAERLFRLPPVEVVARRSVEVARIEQEEKFARQHLTKAASPRPKA
jgi:hypothetical protein